MKLFVGGLRLNLKCTPFISNCTPFINLGKYNWEVTTQPLTIKTEIYKVEQKAEHFVYVCVKSGRGGPVQYLGGNILNCKLTFEFR